MDTALLTAPQREIEVEAGRRLNLLCVGSGKPTVIFESGTGGAAYDWRFVQAAVARKTTACAYDRAGFGFSDPARRVSDADHAAEDLQRLVVKAHLHLPLVLVGHSNGGIYAVRFAQLHRREVSGMVLVDPGFTGQQNFSAYGLTEAKAAELQTGNAEWISGAQHCLDLAKTGVLRPLATSPCLDDPPVANAALHRALQQIESKPAYAAARLSEFESTFKKENGTTLNDREVPLLPRSLGYVPLVVLTASRHPAAPVDFTTQDQAKYFAYWKAGHDHLAELSRCGSNILVPNTGHFIQYDQPPACDRFYLSGCGPIHSCDTSRLGAKQNKRECRPVLR